VTDRMPSAALTVGEVETTYRRAGCGAPVVLLGLRAATERSIVERLTRPGVDRRALVPDGTTLTALTTRSSPEESAFARWLSGFLQGLGLDRPDVVAAAAFEQELVRYQTAHPEELGRVSILVEGGPSEEEIVEQLRRR